jgi:hypothetical protein
MAPFEADTKARSPSRSFILSRTKSQGRCHDPFGVMDSLVACREDEKKNAKAFTEAETAVGSKTTLRAVQVQNTMVIV